MSETFTLKNRRIQVWLISALVFGLVAILAAPPALWLSTVGGILIGVGFIANCARTGQWMTWQNEGSLNWFEGWAATTGIILVVVPLLGMFGRSWLP
jgi:hypothetical protein